MSSCATIFNGTRQSVNFNSDEPGAIVRDRHGEVLCITPCVANVRRAQNPGITMEHNGFAQNVNLQGSFNPTTLWNIFWWPGIFVDLGSGAMWRYSNPSVFVSFSGTSGQTQVQAPFSPARQAQQQTQTWPPQHLTRTTIGAGQRIAVIDPVGAVSISTIEIVREEISNIIVNYTQYMVLERSLINQVLEENRFQASGLVDDAQISEMGRRMGANYVIVSSLTLMADRNYHISSRKIDVVTARVVMQRTARTTQGGGDLMDVVRGMMGLMFLQGN